MIASRVLTGTSTGIKIMAQEDILKVIVANPMIDGKGIKEKLGVNWGVTSQVERLKEKGFVTKHNGATRLSWCYEATPEGIKVITNGHG
jgi:DNA-binding MarR family transcriptional regulator